MPPAPHAPALKQAANPLLFFRRWLANPRQMGAIAPSGPSLCRRIVAATRWHADEAVIELGAGTGTVSRALIEAGLPPSRLFVVEIEPSMAAHLGRVLPGANVICGDAAALDRLIPQQWHGRIGSVICGIPLLLLPFAAQKRLVEAMETVAPGRGFLHFSYVGMSPLPHRRLGLDARRVAWTMRNLPPASVWHFTARPGDREAER